MMRVDVVAFNLEKDVFEVTEFVNAVKRVEVSCNR